MAVTYPGVKVVANGREVFVRKDSNRPVANQNRYPNVPRRPRAVKSTTKCSTETRGNTTAEASFTEWADKRKEASRNPKSAETEK